MEGRVTLKSTIFLCAILMCAVTVLAEEGGAKGNYQVAKFEDRNPFQYGKKEKQSRVKVN